MLSCQDASAQGFTSQAGQFLNMILGDLCRVYDMELTSKVITGNFNPGQVGLIPNTSNIYGSGPYPLPADFLRFKDDQSIWWELLGVKYPLIPCDLSEFDMMVQQAGTQSYPYIIATDMSPADSTLDGGGGNPVFYIYSPPSGAFPFFGRYQSQMPDMVTPESNNASPWFPHQGYLRKKVSACLMGITGDERELEWHNHADGMLDDYLKMKDNKTTRAISVKLDRRRFGRDYNLLPNTKQVGW